MDSGAAYVRLDGAKDHIRIQLANLMPGNDLDSLQFFLNRSSCQTQFTDPRPFGLAIRNLLVLVVHVQNIEMNSSSSESLKLFNLNGKNISVATMTSQILKRGAPLYLYSSGRAEWKRAAAISVTKDILLLAAEKEG